jgi:hypothetical protein
MSVLAAKKIRDAVAISVAMIETLDRTLSYAA